MTSSISSSDLPGFSAPKRVILLTLAFFMMTSGAVMAVNAWIDPFDSAISPVRKQIDRLDEFRTKNVAQWAAFDIHDLPAAAFENAQVVLVGDSRTRLLSGGYERSRAYVFEGKHVLDLSFGGAAINESLDVFRRHRKQLKSVEMVVFGISYDQLNDKYNKRDRYGRALRYANHPWLYLLNFETLERSAPYVFRNPDRPQNSGGAPAARPERLGEATIKCNQSLPPLPPNFPAGNEQVKRNTNLPWPDAHRVFERLVAPELKELDQAGIQHVIFIPPNSPRLEAFLQAGMRLQLDLYARKAASVSRVVRLPPEALKGAVWRDDWHVCSDSGDYLLDQIWRRLYEDDGL
ncbi:MAG: hypothetical protein R3C58_13650 [Parvularculaceae bacterium]